MPEKVVIDTSAMISALIGKRGASREVIRRCLTGKYQPLISNPLFREYEDVSSRKVVIEVCPLSAGEIWELLNAFYSVCSLSLIHISEPTIHAPLYRMPSSD